MNINNAVFEKSFGLFSQLPKSDCVEIAFAGRSNVGKSSLINKLLNRKSLARVSAVPGKTATINFYRLGDIRLVDLPGYGFAKVAKTEKQRWAGLIEGYFNDDRNLALTILLIDSRHAPSKDDIMMIDYLIETETPFIIALTKADKLNKTELAERMRGFEQEIEYFSDIKVILTSSKNGDGMAELREIIEEIAEAGDDDTYQEETE
ncbi:MAG: YihA family ribosome biogenesis GTP-binding protein [Oscillospiraceae bacterium]|nr:YihA family ribosome biogenesis GTP-binding protein [Oscillospiraceae bacterium]